jgi:hypothetical protein
VSRLSRHMRGHRAEAVAQPSQKAKSTTISDPARDPSDGKAKCVLKHLPQGVTTFNVDPIKLARCSAACESRSGFGACVARCMATGEVCDGGLNNCRPL